MARYELKLPKMGESVAEATITNWLKEVGDSISPDEAVLEIATDKVDSEVPSEVAGVLVEKLFQKDDLVKVGQTIAIIETEGTSTVAEPAVMETVPNEVQGTQIQEIDKTIEHAKQFTAAPIQSPTENNYKQSERFYSPLVRNMAREEHISLAELDTITGSGAEGRVTKNDMLAYLEQRKLQTSAPAEKFKDTTSAAISSPVVPDTAPVPTTKEPVKEVSATAKAIPVSVNGQDEIVEMDRMRKLISQYMVQSVQTSAHVQSFIEVDVTNIVEWRDKVKDTFEKREGEKLTFTPIFMELIARALKDFPMMNISVEGDYIIKKKNINLGMAAALPNGNLIVPVIKNADQLNLLGMAKAVNDLGSRAKAGKLKPDDTQGGTYTVTNVGTFGSVFGTPIINQPQVGILALGAIRKVPAVIETPEGDFIGIRKKMFLSHSYDHRVVDGALGGSFVKRVAELMEQFDVNRSF